MKYIVSILFLSVLLSCTKSEVPRFAVFEQSFPNRNKYENPYLNIELKVEIQSPDGKRIDHFGFFDGNGSWKIRIMPDVTGIWKYDATFSDGTKAGSGSFVCIESDLKGPLQKFESNPVWFATGRDEPFLMRSFHVGDRFFAANWNDSLPASMHPRIKFLNWVQDNGYNTLSIASFFTNRDSEGRGKGWDTPHIWPLNFKEFQKAELILDDLLKRGIYIFPFAGFFGRDGNWPTDQAEQEKYIKYILARWGAYYNLLLNVAGPEPLLEGSPEQKAGYKHQMEVEDINRIAGLIQKYDVFHHLITVHNQTSASSKSDPFVNFGWYNFSTIQGPKTTNLERHQNTIFKIRHPDKPYYAQETLWGGNMYHPDYGEEYIRKIGIVLTMNAAMINFADNNGNSSTGFSGTLDMKDSHQSMHAELKKMWDFFETIPFGEMKPDTFIVPSKFVLAGEKEILIYSDRPDIFKVNLPDSGTYSAKWINAANTKEVISSGYLNFNDSIQTPDFADDWLLLLTKDQKQ